MAPSGERRASRRAVLGVLAYLGLLGALLLGAFLLSQSDVIGTGRYVDSVDHDVARLRVLDRYTIYTDESFVPFTSDSATSFILMSLAGMAVLAFALVALREPGEPRASLFFLVTACGVTLLAFDERLELIDSLGYNVEALYVPDMFLYAPPVALFALFFRRVLAASRPALVALVVGVGLFAMAQGFDRLPHDRFESMEEKLEIVASLALAAGVGLLAAHFLPGPQPVQEVPSLAGGKGDGRRDQDGAVDGRADQRR